MASGRSIAHIVILKFHVLDDNLVITAPAAIQQTVLLDFARQNDILVGVESQSRTNLCKGCVDFLDSSDHITLMAFRHLFADEGIDPGAVGFAHQEGVHAFPARGQFIQNGYLQISVHQQG